MEEKKDKFFVAMGCDDNIDFCGSHRRKVLGYIKANSKEEAFEYAKNNIKGFDAGYDWPMSKLEGREKYWNVDKHSMGAYVEEIEFIDIAHKE